jgi:hypothetical protein
MSRLEARIGVRLLNRAACRADRSQRGLLDRLGAAPIGPVGNASPLRLHRLI